MRLPRPLIRTLCITAATIAVTPVAVAAADAATTPPSRGRSVVLSLAPAAPRALAHAARAGYLGRAARDEQVADALPARSTRDLATHWLTAHGFAITAEGPLTVTASAPAATTDDAFRGGHVPQALAGAVDGVVGVTDEHRWYRHALPGGTLPATLVGAYARPAASAGSGATIATVQLSGWSGLTDPSGGDLASWANAAGVALPQITTIGVNGASPSAADASGDDLEVALDQESLLAVAPLAKQRVYVTTNDSVGGVAVWDRILSDVRSGVPITAVSTSWGACEQVFGPSEVAAVERDLQALTALGVAVFAASGDSSAYDCPPGVVPAGTPSVDYPASSPEVIGVGGTDLSTTPTGYAETAWGGTSVDDQPGDGSGGGVSTLFPRPAWQQQVASTLPAMRVVPDIAAEAAPAHGVAVVNGGQWWLVGGTSLAAPTQAGLYADVLAANGDPAGSPIEPHAAMYSAAPAAFRDITSGTNHAYAAAAGYDPVTGLGSPQWSTLQADLVPISVTAPAITARTTVAVAVTAAPGLNATGWAGGETGTVSCADAIAPTAPTTVTLGSSGDRRTSITVLARLADGSCVSADAPVLVDTRAASASATARVVRLRTRPAVRVSWTAADPAPASGVSSYHVQLQRLIGSRVVTVWSRSYAAWRHAVVTGNAGATYRIIVRAVDAAGNTSAAVRSSWASVPVAARLLRHTRGWAERRDQHAFGGRLLLRGQRGQRATATVVGRVVVLVVQRSPVGGYAAVSVDGHRVRVVNLYSTRVQPAVELRVARFARAGRHYVTVTVTGRHGARSRGSVVALAGMIVRQ